MAMNFEGILNDLRQLVAASVEPQQEVLQQVQQPQQEVLQQALQPQQEVLQQAEQPQELPPWRRQQQPLEEPQPLQQPHVPQP